MIASVLILSNSLACILGIITEFKRLYVMLFLNHVFNRRRVLNPLSQLTELIGLTMINLRRFTIFGNNLTFSTFIK